jgi:hypothetical protein
MRPDAEREVSKNIFLPSSLSTTGLLDGGAAASTLDFEGAVPGSTRIAIMASFQ